MPLKTCLRSPGLARGLAAAALALLGAYAAAQSNNGPQRLGTVTLNAGIHAIRAELARTPEQRAIGLMNRPEMPVNDGMLFAFEQPGTQCFWMKDTLLPLSAAFVADDGSIVNIADMQPRTLDSHCSAKPVRFVLEMNRGWFTKRGLAAGSRLSGPMFRP